MSVENLRYLYDTCYNNIKTNHLLFSPEYNEVTKFFSFYLKKTQVEYIIGTLHIKFASDVTIGQKSTYL